MREDKLLPRRQQLLSPEAAAGGGRSCGGSRRPARAPWCRRPPGQALSAPPLTVLDRGRDRLQRLDEATSGPWSGRLATVDRAFAAAAGAVERFPLLQRGERTATRQAAGDSGSRDHTDGPQCEVGGIGQDHPGQNADKG